MLERHAPRSPNRLGTVGLTDLPGAHGSLRLSRFRPASEEAAAPEPTVHRTRYVPGVDYQGMEDNDIRGYVDGTFADGWNQPGQSHVRVGRPPWQGGTPKYGERELLRFLQRWDDVRLPPGARVVDSRVSLAVQRGPQTPLRVLVYAVLKDWCPGEGGRDGNSTSPPNPGEVWWRGPAFEREEWGLPGAGFASDDHPGADTSAAPLARCRYEPGISRLHFESSALTRYIGERCAAGAPLLFLFKLSDHQEDVPGSLLDIFSANFGDSVSVDRRPSLEIAWRSDREVWSLERNLILEHGRTLQIGPTDGRAGDWFAASFMATEGLERPLIEARTADRESRSSWRRVVEPFRVAGGPVEFRITAARDVVALGSPFESTIRETWTPSPACAEAPIRWCFVSPTGEEHPLDAAPGPPHVWTVRFIPDEVGRWTYRWSYCFDAHFPVSESGSFDVLGRDLESVMTRVQTLAAEARTARTTPAEDRDETLHRQRVQFSRLQRAAMALETPESYRSEPGAKRRESLREAREAMWGKPLPQPLPLEPHPRDWPSVHGRPEPRRRAGGWRRLRRALGRIYRSLPWST